ncbi:dTMP kinase [Candidatus Rhodoluna planktonica]|uniref:Thymidylate kinase n=1 Tax=Candidatus Rhodoluna planktonica TaxID=535712 RepID=A0A1D9DY03_9MICO|nr:dTMP kinase [Candidatus Rhodoluna planktonica]AOY55682.1 dTMP kinase [Candidatus Rhodoluna planktonica]
MAGLFISFEGIDGVGKSTQADRLGEWLTSKGKEVLRTLEPGGTDLGQEIRNILLHRKGDVAPRAEALLYAADRAHHVATKIRPALNAGKTVITDRYLDSSVAYQGAGRALDANLVRDLSLFAVENLLPNLTVLLDLDAAAALERRSKTGTEPDRLEREKLEFFEAVRDQYLKLAAAEPNRWLVVDARLDVDEIAQIIRDRVSTLLV